jgi:phosphohistidine phosphatase
VASHRLYLLRHAKSSWDEPALADRDRPLAARGRDAANRIGHHLRSEQITPALVLCSSARRTRETLDRLHLDAPVEIEDGLYGASADELLARLRRLSDDVETVLLIGHNPAIQDLASTLAGGSSPLRDRKYPTGGLATLAFTGSWSELQPGGAELLAFVIPRELS